MRPSKVTTILSVLLCIIVILPLLLLPSQAATYPYVASKNSKVYHMIECGQAANILKSNRVYFSTRSAAEASGRRPCSYCGDGMVSEGNGGGNSNSSSGSSSSGSSSGNHSSATTPPSTQPPATEPQPSQAVTESKKSWWDEVIDDYAIFIYSFPALLIAVGLYFLFCYLDEHKNYRLTKFITIILFVFAIAAIPSAFVVYCIVFVFVGCAAIMFCAVEGIKKLVKYIVACISVKRKKNITRVKSLPSINIHSTEITVSTASVQTHASSPNSNAATAESQQIRVAVKTPSQKVCYMLWVETSSFCNRLIASVSVKQFMSLWAVYFYAVARSISSQFIINKIYSHFDEYAVRYIRQSSGQAWTVETMRNSYREIRPHLNSLKLDITNPGSADFLWNLISRNVFYSIDLPPSAKEQFYFSLKALTRYSRYAFKIDSSQIRYSLCDDTADELLPDD